MGALACTLLLLVRWALVDAMVKRISDEEVVRLVHAQGLQAARKVMAMMMVGMSVEEAIKELGGSKQMPVKLTDVREIGKFELKSPFGMSVAVWVFRSNDDKYAYGIGANRRAELLETGEAVLPAMELEKAN